MLTGSILKQPGGPAQPIGTGSIGAPKQRADHLPDHDQRRIGERRPRLDRERNQCRQATTPLQPANVLGGDQAGDAGDHGVTRAVDTTRLIGLDPKGAYSLQPLDQPLQVGRGRRFRPVAYPAQPRSTLLARIDQTLQPGFLFKGAVADQARVGRTSCLGARDQRDPFQRGRCGHDHVGPAQPLHHDGDDRLAAIGRGGDLNADRQHGA